MVQVRITSQLQSQLQTANQDPNQLLQDFSEWKGGGEDDNYVFGLDALGRGSKFLYHVHMVPLVVQEALADWDYCWKEYRKRTSDRYLFYANGGPRLGYLLIALIDDPGAHEIWNPANKAKIKELEAVADGFFHFGTVP